MKKKTFKLNALSVTSFITDAQKAELFGGELQRVDRDNTAWRDCSYINCEETFKIK
ncbi:hypothetical protein AB9P05_04060 [Roseivirga sp. BDSF3-8]|uniref:hypothetical protein n=1 Tax=Roseivirga sp. BDSF3-8 TaxID=3241598 RepID=UPI003531B997